MELGEEKMVKTHMSPHEHMLWMWTVKNSRDDFASILQDLHNGKKDRKIALSDELKTPLVGNNKLLIIVDSTTFKASIFSRCSVFLSNLQLQLSV